MAQLDAVHGAEVVAVDADHLGEAGHQQRPVEQAHAAQGGEAAEEADEDQGRVHLGLPFENEWFRFRLGDTRRDDGADPYMIDAEYRFRVENGFAISVLTGSLIVPQGMRWLPNNDRLYVVDGGQRSVIEIGGLDVYRQIMTVISPPSPYR